MLTGNCSHCGQETGISSLCEEADCGCQDNEEQDTDFETMPNVTAPIVAPQYRSNWTDQMTKWLNSHQYAFRGPEDWCEWIVSLAPSICDSWGDTYKADRVRMMLIQRIASMQDMLGEFPQDQIEAATSYYQRINAIVDNWAS